MPHADTTCCLISPCGISSPHVKRAWAVWRVRRGLCGSPSMPKPSGATWLGFSSMRQTMLKPFTPGVSAWSAQHAHVQGSTNNTDPLTDSTHGHASLVTRAGVEPTSRSLLGCWATRQAAWPPRAGRPRRAACPTPFCLPPSGLVSFATSTQSEQRRREREGGTVGGCDRWWVVGSVAHDHERSMHTQDGAHQTSLCPCPQPRRSARLRS